MYSLCRRENVAQRGLLLLFSCHILCMWVYACTIVLPLSLPWSFLEIFNFFSFIHLSSSGFCPSAYFLVLAGLCLLYFLGGNFGPVYGI